MILFSLRRSLPFILSLSLTAPLALAQDNQPSRKIGTSGNPIPRFVSIAHTKANMRTGPSMNYPIKWVYQRKGYPLKVTDEYGPWRKVVEKDGTTGWMHVQVLSGKRTALINRRTRSLFKKPITTSPVTLIAEAGVIAVLDKCQDNWCLVEIDGTEGWILKNQLYGTNLK